MKRKRDQDPLQALVLENSNSLKRSKRNSYFFKLARTEVEETALGETVYAIDKSRIVVSSNAPTSVSAGSSESKGDRELSNDILSLIEEQNNNGATAPAVKHKKPIRRKHQPAEPIASYNSKGDYVYDVYFRGQVDDESKFEQLRIAHFTYDEDMFNFVDDQLMDSDTAEVQDDEDDDSNAEDYYQNDYPEDEDEDNNEYLDVEDRRHLNEILDKSEDMVMSDDEDDNYEILHNKRRFSTKDYQDYTEGGFLNKDFEGNDTTQEGFDNLYQNYYNSDDEDYEGPTSFLDDGRVSDENEEEFKRNYFFKTDEDDELAVHRDRIFGKLEKMINEK